MRVTKHPRYQPVIDKDITRFKEIVGDKHVLTDETARQKYGRDETEDLYFPPDVVVRPGSRDEICEIVRYCRYHRIPITPRAAGTGLSGGALPVYGGIVLSVERLNQILEIDEANMMAVVQPGVVTYDLQQAVETRGLFYPPDPASRKICMIGGNLAENAGGPRALKYGVTRDYVRGLEVVLPTGQVLRTGGKLYKNVTGYDLTHLFIGSEGTLGIITEATLRLIPKPAVFITLMIPFADPYTALATVSAIFRARYLPCALEFIDREALAIAREKHGDLLPGMAPEALLLIQLDGDRRSQVESVMEGLGQLCLDQGALDVLVADSEARQNEVWEWRRSVAEAVKSASIYKEEDAVVPRDRLPDLLRAVKQLVQRYGFRAACYGHAGDGNIHINILRMDLDDVTWIQQLPEAIRSLFQTVVELGGTLSGEHGIGYVQKDYMPIAVPSASLELMARFKRLLDPDRIMNPGKVLPDPYLMRPSARPEGA